MCATCYSILLPELYTLSDLLLRLVVGTCGLVVCSILNTVYHKKLVHQLHPLIRKFHSDLGLRKVVTSALNNIVVVLYT